MIISITGAPGSGKSTIAKKLASKLNYQLYYMGDIRRQKARSLNMTLAEYNKMGENNPKTDYDIDEYVKKLATDEDNFIIDSRTAWHFIPHSLKIYLDVNRYEGAKRILLELQGKNNRNEDHNLNTLEDVIVSNRQREESDNRRYQTYYNIDIFNKKNYNFVLDTTNLTREEVLAKVYEFVCGKMSK